ncbi:hypothetical protein [Nesterenkonia ebinurensis]|uniref:hypothetical protein n=1 Tax=Nesterenkonia ebinurensis TaxID=2608252 RepID=UPI00123D800C|nr:hypothetical protein [Nesterenkonia ebinurensis]
MKTTLDIDEPTLVAARRYAASRGISVDEAISYLTRFAIDVEDDPVVRARHRGFPMMEPRPGHKVTHQMVEEALDEIDY